MLFVMGECLESVGLAVVSFYGIIPHVGVTKNVAWVITIPLSNLLKTSISERLGLANDKYAFLPSKPGTKYIYRIKNHKQTPKMARGIHVAAINFGPAPRSFSPISVNPAARLILTSTYQRVTKIHFHQLICRPRVFAKDGAPAIMIV
jgi:hypothetical protein